MSVRGFFPSAFSLSLRMRYSYGVVADLINLLHLAQTEQVQTRLNAIATL